MDNVIATHDYEISSFLVNPQKRLGLYSLLNILQDAAWRHVTKMGHGDQAIAERKVFWVVTRQNLVMKQWPEWGNRIQIRTWIRSPEGAFAARDFEILQNGSK